MTGGRCDLASSADRWAMCLVFSAVLGCGRSPELELGSTAAAGASDDAIDVPSEPSHTCEWSSNCGDAPCANTERAAAAIEALVAEADARGFSGVLEPLDAEQVSSSDNVVLTYALRHPSFESISTFVTSSPSFADISAHIDEWGDTWLDPAVTVVPRAQIQEQIDRCPDARLPSCDATLSTAYDPCVHNQNDFMIAVGNTEQDDVEFATAIDPRTGDGIYCSHSPGC